MHFGNTPSTDYKLTQFMDNTTRIQDAPTEQRILFGPDLPVNSTAQSVYGSNNLVQVASPHLQHLLVFLSIGSPSNETN